MTRRHASLEPVEPGIALLKEIRDEVRKTNVRMDETNGRLDALGTHLVDSVVRVATALTDLSGTLQENTGFLRSVLDLKPRVERCEREIAELRAKLPHETQ